ncbi:hypothetical protein PHYBLDRAFT_181579 [Phycomyces blakesleeanus NRRL 1555(-)]|uniref:Uncharacterized protein n=1 Tax=Phycomyces blakesleeanus (strain ATCC 8743b / DSM 1359 / FGSC 10004 / NBRC 33097 / NRRL 1555) TaxID=763407 RepID=A0A163DUS9_PHYB8|nr:hypothetical protein PHYBLDRAFT_181579 [Phycomyces blakesleeanus NRRL 1555(-)]OAD73560.1 hypothetical protein PHYBLDRAFT_181579 [Phycomyces blakesleeanus NRRL 1555(-)]|eukprot:XP_018291600.1 hypothetical protein PHYBLDRAFT_181579 [Phycomyces blakesleeanus NRRL 1555(-)]
MYTRLVRIATRPLDASKKLAYCSIVGVSVYGYVQACKDDFSLTLKTKSNSKSHCLGLVYLIIFRPVLPFPAMSCPVLSQSSKKKKKQETIISSIPALTKKLN